jgi:hypothetical protein
MLLLLLLTSCISSCPGFRLHLVLVMMLSKAAASSAAAMMLQLLLLCCLPAALLLMQLSVVPSDMRDVMTSASQHGKSQRQEDGDSHHLTQALEDFGHSHHRRSGAHGGNEPVWKQQQLRRQAGLL